MLPHRVCALGGTWAFDDVVCMLHRGELGLVMCELSFLRHVILQQPAYTADGREKNQMKVVQCVMALVVAVIALIVVPLLPYLPIACADR